MKNYLYKILYLSILLNVVFNYSLSGQNNSTISNRFMVKAGYTMHRNSDVLKLENIKRWDPRFFVEGSYWFLPCLDAGVFADLFEYSSYKVIKDENSGDVPYSWPQFVPDTANPTKMYYFVFGLAGAFHPLKLFMKNYNGIFDLYIPVKVGANYCHYGESYKKYKLFAIRWFPYARVGAGLNMQFHKNIGAYVEYNYEFSDHFIAGGIVCRF